MEDCCKDKININWVKKLPSELCSNSIYFVKSGTNIKMYVTNYQGVASQIGEMVDSTVTITSPDESIFVNAINGQTFELSLSAGLKILIESALRSGDNISELVNDAGYITLADLPPSETPTLDQVLQEGNSTNTQIIANAGITVPDAILSSEAPNLGQVEDLVATKPSYAEVILQTEKGTALGVATLDGGGKVPVGQLPSSIMTYEGTWNASTNTPTLTNGVGDSGMVYLTTTPGTVNFGAGAITFALGDWAVYNGSIWQKSLNSNTVVSVAGLQGVISATDLKTALDNVTNVSIQNSTGIEQFKMTDKLLLKGVEFDSPTKLLSVSPLRPYAVFLSNSLGNDSTAEIENSKKPFKTLNAILDWFESQSHKGINYTIVTLDSGTFISDKLRNLTDFRIENFTNAIIEIQSTFYVSKNINFNMPSGTLVFRLTNSSVIQDETFTNAVGGILTENIYFNIRIVSLINSRTVGLPVLISSRGIFRGVVISDTFKIGTLNIGVNTWHLGQGFQASSNFIVEIGVINNSLNVPLESSPFFSGRYKVRIYNNLALSTQEIKANELEITTLSSPSAFVNLKISTLNIKGDATFNNARLQGTVLNQVIKVIGDGGTITFNYSISGYIFDQNQGITKPVINGYSRTGYVLVKNINFSVPLTSLVSGLFEFDLRPITGGYRTGVQYVFDDFEIDMKNSNTLFLIKGYTEYTPGDFQVIFRNSVRIFNNNYLFTGGYTQAEFPETFVIKEYASVYHDFGLLHPSDNFPKIYEFANYNNEKRQELRVYDKKILVNKILSSKINYVIDGALNLLPTESIIVPVGGLSLSGYGFDVSSIKATSNGSTIFKSPVGGCGNLFLSNISIESSGTGSKVFDLTNAGAPTGGADAIELNVVNFDNCTSLGELTNFRQGLWDNIGIFGVKDGLTLSGVWSGGFRADLTIVRNFGIASTTSILFKAGTGLLFKSRFFTDLNADFKVAGSISNFTSANFDINKLYQLKGAQITRNSVIDPTQNYTGTLNHLSAVSDWSGNNGVYNSVLQVADGVNLNEAATVGQLKPQIDIVPGLTHTISPTKGVVMVTYTGTTNTTTLPPIAGNSGLILFLKNAGSGDVTLNSNLGGNDVWEGGSSSATFNIPSGTIARITNDSIAYNIL